jgi:hypothetical protein
VIYLPPVFSASRLGALVAHIERRDFGMPLSHAAQRRIGRGSPPRRSSAAMRPAPSPG